MRILCGRLGRRSAVGITVLLLSPLAAGCTGTNETGVVEVADHYVLISEETVENAAGEGFAGRLALVGNCLGIDQTTVVWPRGTQIVAEDPLVIDVPGLGRVGVGDEVVGGADELVDSLPKGIDELPSSCSEERIVAFWSQ